MIANFGTEKYFASVYHFDNQNLELVPEILETFCIPV
jgi:hypothetical protein